MIFTMLAIMMHLCIKAKIISYIWKTLKQVCIVTNLIKINQVDGGKKSS